MKYPVRTHTLSALGMMLMSVPYALLAQGVAQGVAQNSLVEQVIVTARKRSEPATAVPMSFNVIDATTIDTFRIRNLADLAPLHTTLPSSRISPALAFLPGLSAAWACRISTATTRQPLPSMLMASTSHPQ